MPNYNEQYVTRFANNWSAFAQPDGPNTPVYYLACHDVGDISESLGDRTLVTRPDPYSDGTVKEGMYKGAPGLVEFTVTPSVREAMDLMRQYLKCDAPFYIQDYCGYRNDWNTWQTQMIAINPAGPTSETIAGLAKRDINDNAQTTTELSFVGLNKYWVFKPRVSQLSIEEKGDLVGIDVQSRERCTSECGVGFNLGQHIVLAGFHHTEQVANPTPPPDTTTEVVAGNVQRSVDQGVTFNKTTTKPFPTATTTGTPPVTTVHAPGAIVSVPIGQDKWRLVTFLGVADANNPAQSAYSDDDGATWTTVNVGTTNGQYVMSGRAVVSLPDGSAIWVGTNGGFVYKSTDKGVTWKAVLKGTLTTQDIHSVARLGKNLIVASGADGAALKSFNGGESWSTMTAPVVGQIINRIFPVTKQRYFASAQDGQLVYTENGGQDWYQRLSLGGSITDVAFVGEIFGMFVHNTGTSGADDAATQAATVYFTRNGGYSWEDLQTPDLDAYMHMIHMLSPNEALIVGAAPHSVDDSIDAVILKVAPEPAI